MVDNIKIGSTAPINQYQSAKKQPQSEAKAGPQASSVTISNDMQKLSQKVLDAGSPPDNSAKVAALKEAYNNGTYKIDHQQTAQDLINEYYPNKD